VGSRAGARVREVYISKQSLGFSPATTTNNNNNSSPPAHIPEQRLACDRPFLMSDLTSFFSSIEQLAALPEQGPEHAAGQEQAAAAPAAPPPASSRVQVEVVASSAPAISKAFLAELVQPYVEQRAAAAFQAAAAAETKKERPMPRSVRELAPEEVVYAIHGAPKEALVETRKVDKKLRVAAGQVWEDKKLEEWPDNDYRLFVGNLSGEVRDEQLSGAFSEYPSMHKVRVVRDNKDVSKGFGFVGFLDPFEMLRAMREKNGALIGLRPVQIKKANLEQRDAKVVRGKQKDKEREERKLAQLTQRQ
jgi:hypothetical protein